MTRDDTLGALLRQAMPPVAARPPGHDLWPAVLSRTSPAPDWSWLDLGAAAAIVILLTIFPEALWLLLYHL